MAVNQNWQILQVFCWSYIPFLLFACGGLTLEAHLPLFFKSKTWGAAICFPALFVIVQMFIMDWVPLFFFKKAIVKEMQSVGPLFLNIARIANAVQVPICLLVSNSDY